MSFMNRSGVDKNGQSLCACIDKFIAVVAVLLLFSGCIAKNEVEVSLKNSIKKTSFTASVLNVAIINNKLVINGSDLASVKSIQIKNNLTNETLTVESSSANQIIAKGLRNITMGVGQIFDLILSDAHGAATYQVAFSLQNGSVTAAHLSSMDATKGQILKYNGSAWVASAMNAQTYIGAFDASAAFAALPDPLLHASGDYYIIGQMGTIAGITYQVGDWIILNSTGTTWDKVSNSSNVVSSFKGRRGLVTPQSGDYVWSDITKTGSKLEDIADIDVGGRLNGQVLKWDSTASKWVIGDDISGAAGGPGSVSDAMIVDIAASKITGTLPVANGGTGSATKNFVDLSTAQSIAGSKTFSSAIIASITGNAATVTTNANLTGDVSSVGNATTIGAAKVNLAMLSATGTPGATKYLKGDNTWSTFVNDVIASTLGAITESDTTILAADSIQTAFNKTQGQISALKDDYVSKTGSNAVTGTFDLTGITAFLSIPTPTGVTASEAANVAYVKSLFGKSGAMTTDTTGSLVTNTATSSTDSIAKIGLDVQATGAWSGATATNTGLNVNVSGGTTNYAALFNGGNVGIGTTTPKSKLDVNGAIRLGVDATACSATIAGAIKYNSGTDSIEYCNGSTWSALGVSGAGIQSVIAGTGLTGGTIIASGTIAVDAGVTANKILQLDASAKIPAVDGSLLTNLDPSKLSGVVSVAKGGTGVSTLTANGILFGNGTSGLQALSAMSDGQIIVGKTSFAPQVVTMSGDVTIGNTGATVIGTSGARDATTYLAGDNTWRVFADNIFAAPLPALSTAGITHGNHTIAATDPMNVAFNKILFDQGDYISKTATSTVNGTLAINNLTGNLVVPDAPFGMNSAVNQSYVLALFNSSGAKTANSTGSTISNTATSSTDSLAKIGLDIQSTGVWNGATATNTGLSVNVFGGTTNYAALFNGGNVGIGTTTPQNKLDVNGSIRVADDGVVCSVTTIGTIRTNTTTSLLESCDGASWLSLNSDSAIPPSSVILMNSCPGGWTDNGTIGGGAGFATCGGVACHFCQSPNSYQAVPASSIFLMESCPTKWSSLGVAVGTSAAGFSNISFTSCQSPAQASALPQNSRVMMSTCPSSWNDLGQTSSPLASCPSGQCHVCQAPGSLTGRSLLGDSGGTVMAGGNIVLSGGVGGSTSGTGGAVNIYGGTPVDGIGGSISIAAGSGVTSTATARNGGSLSLTAGSGASNGNGADLSLFSGIGNGTGTNGNILLNSSGSGNVGIGTTAPSAKMTINDPTPDATFINSTYSKLAIQAGDTIGSWRSIDFGATGGTSYDKPVARIGMQYTASGSYLSLGTSNAYINGVTNQAMTIAPNSNVGIGTAGPASKLDIVEGTSEIKMGLNLTANSGPSLILASSANVYSDIMFNTVSTDQVRLRGSSYGLAIGGTNPRLNIGFADANYTTAALAVNGNVGIGTATPGFMLDVNGSIAAVGALQAHSDRRLKKNIMNVDNSLDKLSSLNGVYFDWRKDEFPEIHFEGGRQLGVIAQDVEKVFPEAVAKNKDGIRSVAYTMLIAPMIEAIKELNKRVVELFKVSEDSRREIASVKAENAQLKKDNAAIKAYLCSKDPRAVVCK